jgi:carbohydrate diacid regulator
VLTGSEHFEPIAREVSRRAAELLCAKTVVISDQQRVVAASEAEVMGGQAGAHLEAQLHDSLAREGLKIPFKVGGREGEVVVGESLGREVISPRLAKAVVELVIYQATLVHELPDQLELKNKFIHDLLRGKADDEETVHRHAGIFGIDLSPPRAVILIDAANYILAPPDIEGHDQSEQARRRAQLVIGSIVGFFSLPNDTICAYIGEGEVAVLKASDTKNLYDWAEGEVASPSGPSWANLAALKRAGAALLARLQADTSTSLGVGIGRYHRGVAGLSRSYQDAKVALSLGRRFHGENRVHCLDALGVATFVGVADEQTKIELARHLLSPLDDEPELIATLNALFAADGHPTEAARHLGIHRNTLAYRLDKIALLTGMDVHSFDAAVQMRLALLLRSFAEPAAAGS